MGLDGEGWTSGTFSDWLGLARDRAKGGSALLTALGRKLYFTFTFIHLGTIHFIECLTRSIINRSQFSVARLGIPCLIPSLLLIINTVLWIQIEIFPLPAMPQIELMCYSSGVTTGHQCTDRKNPSAKAKDFSRERITVSHCKMIASGHFRCNYYHETWISISSSSTHCQHAQFCCPNLCLKLLG